MEYTPMFTVCILYAKIGTLVKLVLDNIVIESTSSTPQKHSSFTRRWTIRLSILFVLLAILVGVNWLYASITATEIIRTGEAGDLLYVSAYDGFLDEWDLYEGQQNAQIIDDALQIGVTSANQASWSTTQHIFADFDMTVKAQAIEGPIDNAFGVIFRLQSGAEDTCDLPMVILCGVADIAPLLNVAVRQLVDDTSGTDSIHYYTFLISSDGYYSVWKVENGVEEKLSAWIASPLINQDLNAENTVRVVARGSQFQFFINGEQVSLCIPNDPEAVSTYSGGECIDGTMQGVLTDASIPSGQLGTIAQATQTGGGGVVIQFDNLLVFSPANNVEKSESNA